MMKIEPKSNCPLNNFEPCKQLDCAWFMQVRGTNPNTGKEVDEWGCAVLLATAAIAPTKLIGGI